MEIMQLDLNDEETLALLHLSVEIIEAVALSVPAADPGTARYPGEALAACSRNLSGIRATALCYSDAR
jgi:hypothetical protein